MLYTVCRLSGDAVAGISEMAEDVSSATALPPSWLSYVSVDDADATAARVKQLGGQVVDDAFDVGNLGRMAVLEDPQGAVFAVWHPRTRIGAERVNDIGCLCMNELVSTDIGAARAFYERLFGWTTDISDATSRGPHMILRHGNINAALYAAPESTSAHWRACFTVLSTEKAVEQVRQLGGHSCSRRSTSAMAASR